MADIEQLRRNVQRLELDIANDEASIDSRADDLRVKVNNLEADATDATDRAIGWEQRLETEKVQLADAIVAFEQIKADLRDHESAIRHASEALALAREHKAAAEAAQPPLVEQLAFLAGRRSRASMTRKRAQLDKAKALLNVAEGRVANAKLARELAEAARLAREAEEKEKLKRMADKPKPPPITGPIMSNLALAIARAKAGR